MNRRPPRGKPSLAPTVDLLSRLGKLVRLLREVAPNKEAFVVIETGLLETSTYVSHLLTPEAPTRAMKRIVRMAEDTLSVIDSLKIYKKRGWPLMQLGSVYQEDIHSLAKFLKREVEQGGPCRP